MNKSKKIINSEIVEFNYDIIEKYFELGYTDGLPVVPPTKEKIDLFVNALGGDSAFVECNIPPRWGALTREVLAINMIMAGCKPEYGPVVRASMKALTERPFNLNGVQATTHMASPLIIVNGPIAKQIDMNGGANAFGSGNRANATIGRAIRLIMLNVGGGKAPDLDKCTLGNPAKYTYCICENEEASPFSPYHVEKGYDADISTVFVIAAESPHSVTDHLCNDPEGILDTMCSAMSNIASNTSVLNGHCAVALGLEHAKTISKYGWTRNDIKNYLFMHSGNKFVKHSRNDKYGKVYNRNLPKWYKRDPESWIPIIESPERIHLFIIGGDAGRFSAFIPGWGHMSNPVLKPIDDSNQLSDKNCDDGLCEV